MFEAPQAPINRWRVHVPEAGMSVQIDPMIAATRQEDPDTDTPDAPATTDLLAFVGAAPTVRIAWNPKAEGASGLTAFATVQVEQQMVISEGVARSYGQAGLRHLAFHAESVGLGSARRPEGRQRLRP